AERGSTSRRNQFSFQVAENTTIKKMSNELRFQVNRNTSTSTPMSAVGAYAGIYSINVADAFQGGPAQNTSNTRSTSYQVADQIRGTLKNGKIQFNGGIQFDYDSNFNNSRNNYVGTFEFASLHDYCYAYYLVFGVYNGVNC